jgi:hypothetical protein
MSNNNAPLGATTQFTDFEFREYQGGPLVDDDRYNNTATYWPSVSVLNPSSNVGGAPAVSVYNRESQGIYDIQISVPQNATLTSSLSSSDLALGGYRVQFQLQINGAVRTFQWTFNVVGAGTLQQGTNYIGDREKLRRKLALETDEVLTGFTGTNININGRFSTAVQLTKNGTILNSPADYTFNKPNNFVFTIALAATDRIVATMTKGDTDADLDEMLSEAHTILSNALIRCSLSFATIDVGSQTELARLETDLAAAIWREDQYERVGKDARPFPGAGLAGGAHHEVVPPRWRARAISALEEFLMARFPSTYIAPGDAAKAARQYLSMLDLRKPSLITPDNQAWGYYRS